MNVINGSGTADRAVAPSLKDSTVLVTGGAGFIGSSLSRRLAASVKRWVAIDNLHPQVHKKPSRPEELDVSAELIIGDVVDSARWDAWVSDIKPDVVVHLAAETGTGQSLTHSTRHAGVNVVGTTQMLDAFTRMGHLPAHIVLTSSRAIYGEGVWRREDGSTFQPTTRTHRQLMDGEWDFPSAVHLPNSVAGSPPNPSNIYAATKLAQENILAAWTGANDIELSILRLQNVYGPGQSLSNPYTGIVSLFSQMASRGESIPLYEDGEITRDFVFIDDVVSALAAALAQPPSEHVRVLDVGSGHRTTIRDLANEVARYYGAPAPKVTGQFRDGDVRHAACVVDDTVARLDWAPSWSLGRGVAALQGWIASQSD